MTQCTLLAAFILLVGSGSQVSAQNTLTQSEKLIVAMHSFAGDSVSDFGDKGPYSGNESFRFASDESLSPSQELEVKVLPGQTRKVIEAKWRENGGLTESEYYLPTQGQSSDVLGVRIMWKPVAMPNAVFADKKKRSKWLRVHLPLPSPEDVAMKVSRPFWTGVYID